MIKVSPVTSLLTLSVLLLTVYSCKTLTQPESIEAQHTNPILQLSEMVRDSALSFPPNTQLSIALIDNGLVSYVGVKRTADTVEFVDNRRSAFEIGSISKVFTSTLLAHSVIEDGLSLDAGIRDHLDCQINLDEEITFAQLANHTSGLPRLPSNLNLLLVDFNNPYKDYNDTLLIEYLSKDIAISQSPGLKYEYSNLSAGLLGYVLTQISDSSYEALLQARVFEKYQMNHSTTQRESLKVPLVHGRTFDGGEASNWDFGVLVGAGGILSTVEDMSRFAIAQLDPENDVMALTHKETFKVSERMSTGLGWHLLKQDWSDELIWHNGGTGGYTSSMALDTDAQKGVVILSNVSAFNPNSSGIDELCFALLEKLITKK